MRKQNYERSKTWIWQFCLPCRVPELWEWPYWCQWRFYMEQIAAVTDWKSISKSVWSPSEPAPQQSIQREHRKLTPGFLHPVWHSETRSSVSITQFCSQPLQLMKGVGWSSPDHTRALELHLLMGQAAAAPYTLSTAAELLSSSLGFPELCHGEHHLGKQGTEHLLSDLGCTGRSSLARD